MTDIILKRYQRLFSKQFRYQASQRGGFRVGEMTNFTAQTSFADGSNLIYRDFGGLMATSNGQPAAPRGMELTGERANRYCFRVLVEFIQADNDDRARLRHFRALNRVKICPSDVVAIHAGDPLRRRVE